MDWMDVEFSTDLVNSAYLHLCFLDQVDNFEKILKGEVLQHACRRYEQLWLHFAYENRHVDLMAPVDIYWLWYIHMLQPLAYRRDCRKMLKTTLDHRFQDETKTIPCVNNAIELWYTAYPKEGFNIIRNGEYVKPNRNKGQIDMEKPSKLSADLVSLAETHMHFCYQVALPHFRDRKYLENAEKRYKQFLCLKRLEPDEFLTPSVDILLMWYTHMCNPVAYANDTMHICGKILDNSVKVKPALINDRFILARERTNELWKRVSGEELIQPGTKLRSSESRKQILQMTDDDMTDNCAVLYKIYLGHAELQNLPLRKHNHYLNLTILRVPRDNNLPEEVLLLHGTKHMWNFSTSVLFNTIQHKEFRVILTSMNKILCMRDAKTIATASIDVKNEFSKMRSIERNVSLDVKMMSQEFSSEINLVLDGAVDRPVPVLCDLTLKKSDFVQQKLTNKELRRVWGHEGFPNSFRQNEHTCFTATHIMTNHENEDSFRCRLTHIPELLHSGVEIMFKQKLVATSHLIGSSQLPYPSQVEMKEITMAFDPELGERAMLIRNHSGDWGLCIARWMQETDGGLDVRFMKLAGKNKVQRVEIQRADIEFQSFNANLYSGKIMINPSGNTVAENLATFWSVCLLYVLCSPGGHHRMLLVTAPAEKATNGEEPDGEEKNQQVYVEGSKCIFLIAAGLNTETPSNQYMRAKYGSLTYDLLIDAQDIIVEEQKTSRRLLKKESIMSVASDDDSRSKKRKKKSSKIKENAPKETKTRIFVEPVSDVNPVVNKDNAVNQQTQSKDIANSDVILKQNVVHVKPKKVKKRQSSKLEDMLAVSDDSITKDEVEVTKLIKDEKGRKIIVRKISSRLTEEIAPSDDSLDEEIKEREEFFKGLNAATKGSIMSFSGDEETMRKRNEDSDKRENKHIETTGLTVQLEGEGFKREETSLIREKVEKRKRQTLGNRSVQNDGTTDSGLDNKEASTVTFDLNTDDVKALTQSNTDASDAVLDETRSDTSGSIRETRSMRKQRIAKDRERKFPLSDEDLLEYQENVQNDGSRRRKRKKSKQRLNIQGTSSEI